MRAILLASVIFMSGCTIIEVNTGPLRAHLDLVEPTWWSVDEPPPPKIPVDFGTSNIVISGDEDE